MNVTVFPISSGTVNNMSVPCVDKDSLDMHKRTVLTITMMTELEASSISKEKKLVIITENVKTPTTLMCLFWNPQFNMKSSFFLFLIHYFNMFPIPFTQTFEFLPSTSILEPAITPTFEQYYPPPVLTKHPVWYSLDADFFISI